MKMLSVFRPTRFFELMMSDASNISRDPTLVFAIILSIVPAIAISYWRVDIDSLMFSKFEVVSFTGYILALVICLPAFLIGWVTGFLFLEDRDDGVLLAIDITPIGKSGFFAYRVTITALITILITIFAMILLLPDLGWGMVLFVSFLVAVEAICAAFVLPAIARNKVEGLAVTKLTNIAIIVPLIAIIPSPFRYLGAIIPTYWIGELFQVSSANYLSMPTIIGFTLISHIFVGVIFYRIAVRSIG